MDHYRPDDDLSDRSKHVVIITIGKMFLVFFITNIYYIYGKYSPVIDGLLKLIIFTITRKRNHMTKAIVPFIVINV